MSFNRTVRVFYDGERAHARPTCHKVEGKAQRRRGFVMPYGHPADARYIEFKGSVGPGSIVVAVCSTCWPTVFDTAAWGRGRGEGVDHERDHDHAGR